LLFTEAIAVVYIHPWLNSLNDSPLNKTLCCADFSEKIKDKTPYDYFHEYEPDNWSRVVNRAKELFANTTDFPSNYKKYQRFVKRYYRIKYINNQLDAFLISSLETVVDSNTSQEVRWIRNKNRSK
jgi:CRISPR-associated endonuclease Csn1